MNSIEKYVKQVREANWKQILLPRPDSVSERRNSTLREKFDASVYDVVNDIHAYCLPCQTHLCSAGAEFDLTSLYFHHLNGKTHKYNAQRLSRDKKELELVPNEGRSVRCNACLSVVPKMETIDIITLEEVIGKHDKSLEHMQNLLPVTDCEKSFLISLAHIPCFKNFVLDIECKLCNQAINIEHNAQHHLRCQMHLNNLRDFITFTFDMDFNSLSSDKNLKHVFQEMEQLLPYFVGKDLREFKKVIIKYKLRKVAVNLSSVIEKISSNNFAKKSHTLETEQKGLDDKYSVAVDDRKASLDGDISGAHIESAENMSTVPNLQPEAFSSKDSRIKSGKFDVEETVTSEADTRTLDNVQCSGGSVYKSMSSENDRSNNIEAEPLTSTFIREPGIVELKDDKNHWKNSLLEEKKGLEITEKYKENMASERKDPVASTSVQDARNFEDEGIDNWEHSLLQLEEKIMLRKEPGIVGFKDNESDEDDWEKSLLQLEKKIMLREERGLKINDKYDESEVREKKYSSASPLILEARNFKFDDKESDEDDWESSLQLGEKMKLSEDRGFVVNAENHLTMNEADIDWQNDFAHFSRGISNKYSDVLKIPDDPNFFAGFTKPQMKECTEFLNHIINKNIWQKFHKLHTLYLKTSKKLERFNEVELWKNLEDNGASPDDYEVITIINAVHAYCVACQLHIIAASSTGDPSSYAEHHINSSLHIENLFKLPDSYKRIFSSRPGTFNCLPCSAAIIYEEKKHKTLQASIEAHLRLPDHNHFTSVYLDPVQQTLISIGVSNYFLKQIQNGVRPKCKLCGENDNASVLKHVQSPTHLKLIKSYLKKKFGITNFYNIYELRNLWLRMTGVLSTSEEDCPVTESAIFNELQSPSNVNEPKNSIKFAATSIQSFIDDPTSFSEFSNPKIRKECQKFLLFINDIKWKNPHTLHSVYKQYIDESIAKPSSRDYDMYIQVLNSYHTYCTACDEHIISRSDYSDLSTFFGNHMNCVEHKQMLCSKPQAVVIFKPGSRECFVCMKVVETGLLQRSETLSSATKQHLRTSKHKHFVKLLTHKETSILHSIASTPFFSNRFIPNIVGSCKTCLICHTDFQYGNLHTKSPNHLKAVKDFIENEMRMMIKNLTRFKVQKYFWIKMYNYMQFSRIQLNDSTCEDDSTTATSSWKALPKPVAGGSGWAGELPAGTVRKGGKAKATPICIAVWPQKLESNSSSTEKKTKKKRKEQGSTRTPSSTPYAVPSYSTAWTPVRMAVVLKNFPEALLTGKQGTAVLIAINSAASADPDPDRQFDGVGQMDGAVLVTCRSEKACKWLMDTVEGLSVEGLGQLCVVNAREILQRPRVAFLPTTSSSYVNNANRKNAEPSALMSLKINPPSSLPDVTVLLSKKHKKKAKLLEAVNLNQSACSPASKTRTESDVLGGSTSSEAGTTIMPPQRLKAATQNFLPGLKAKVLRPTGSNEIRHSNSTEPEALAGNTSDLIAEPNMAENSSIDFSAYFDQTPSKIELGCSKSTNSAALGGSTSSIAGTTTMPSQKFKAATLVPAYPNKYFSPGFKAKEPAALGGCTSNLKAEPNMAVNSSSAISANFDLTTCWYPSFFDNIQNNKLQSYLSQDRNDPLLKKHSELVNVIVEKHSLMSNVSKQEKQSKTNVTSQKQNIAVTASASNTQHSKYYYKQEPRTLK